MKYRTSTRALVASVAAGLVIAACTGGIGDPSQFDDDDGSSSSGSGSGTGGSSSSGVAGFDPGEGGQGGFQECAGVAEEATFIPVSMFIAVDKSGSMSNDNKWVNVKAAFTSFFTDPGADGLNVALRFWPDAGCEDPYCDINGCSNPQVPLGSLADPNHETALINIFNSKSPGGMTPMWAALGGACQWAQNHQSQNEGAEKVVVILVTDGAPTACDTNINNIASHAANAYAAAEILTFAVGLQGSNESQMNIIATAGQTAPAFFIGNGNAQAELLAALQAIQQTVVACSFAMPESDDPNNPVDPNQVNITFTPGGGGEPVVIGQVASEAECTSQNGGWYYDNPANPSAIFL
ncbi:MAG: VWA domain-containing protein, partial [Deltaproteobacteria bacterium]|nr:VWA domain-containing protein [Deltaproteobacteria bacterium]